MIRSKIRDDWPGTRSYIGNKNEKRLMIREKCIGFVLMLIVLGVPAAVLARCVSDQDAGVHRDSLYGDLSDMEHCISNYRLSIEKQDINGYAQIFRTDCEFITVMGEFNLDQVFEISQQSTIRKRGLLEELEMMKGMFGAAREIRFSFEPGVWKRADSLGGETCLDCWETCRKSEYSIVFNVESEGEEPGSLTGASRIWLYVRPVNGKWKIFRLIEDEIDDTGE